MLIHFCISSLVKVKQFNCFYNLNFTRQKRDRLERAHSQGFKAGLAGRSKELCPYQQVDPKSEWLGGWREAIENRNMYKT